MYKMPLIVLSILIIPGCGDRVPRLDSQTVLDNQRPDISDRLSEERRNEIRDNLLNSIANRPFTEPDPAAYRDSAGTRFVKISGLGLPLRPSSQNSWSCVYDYDSKLIWEVKGELGRQYSTASYTNTTNVPVGQTPTTHRGICEPHQQDASQPGLYEGDSCHTEAYVAYINEKGLCGFNDWRMPSKDEVLTFLDSDRDAPFYNRTYFPHPDLKNLWTGDNADNDTGVTDGAIYFPLLANVLTQISPRGNRLLVRLVRGPLTTP